MLSREQIEEPCSFFFLLANKTILFFSKRMEHQNLGELLGHDVAKFFEDEEYYPDITCKIPRDLSVLKGRQDIRNLARDIVEVFQNSTKMPVCNYFLKRHNLPIPFKIRTTPQIDSKSSRFITDIRNHIEENHLYSDIIDNNIVITCKSLSCV